MRNGKKWAFACVLLGSGCYEGANGAMGGTDGETDSVASEGGSAGEGGDETGEPSGEEGCGPPSAPLRRLSRRELDATLRDLLGDETQPATTILHDDRVPGAFDTHANLNPVNDGLVYDYMLLAEDVSARASGDLTALTGCDDPGSETCAIDFIASLCPRALRRPCSADERDAWLATWSEASELAEPADGYRVMLTSVLQSADFLYRPEIGVDGSQDPERRALSGYEVASRLSYLLWGTMPDDVLFEAAASGALDEADGVTQQATRMLADPRAVTTTVHFHQQWLGISAIGETIKAQQFAGYTDIRDDLQIQAAMLIEDVTLGGGSLEELLTASYTYLNDPLADFYGLPRPGTGDAFERVSLEEGRHAGILTHPAFLATYGSMDASAPVRRGLAVLEQLLCSSPPPPPPDVSDTLPEVELDGTTRDRYEAHTSDPSCAGCHIPIDGIGFSFEHYDAVGRWRDEENGHPIDASGELSGTDVDGTFDGAAELGARLAQSEQVSACYVRNLFEFTYGATIEGESACVVEPVAAAFIDEGGNFESLILALVASDDFRTRGEL